MFKKSHDQMFRKVQLKLFLMIVSILLAVFIVLIGSINVMTKAVMRGQSKEVLMDIASGLEFDDQTYTFSYTGPSNEPKAMKHEEKQPPAKPPQTSASTTAQDTTVTSGESTTATDNPSEAVSSAPSTDAPTEQHVPPPPAEPQAPNEPEAPQEQQAEEPQSTESQTSPSTDAAAGQQDWSQWGQQDWANWAAQQDWGGGQQGWGQQGWGGGQQGWGQQGWGGGQQGSGQQDWGSWGQQSGDQQNGSDSSNPWNPWDQTNPWNPWNNMNPWNPWTQNGTGSLKIRDNEKKDDAVKIYEDKKTFKNYEESADENAEIAAESSESAIEPQSFGTASDSYTVSDTVYKGENVLDGFTVLSNSDSSTSSSSTSSAGSSSKPASEMGMQYQKVEPIPKKLGSIECFAIMADTNGEYLATLNNDKLDKNTAQKYITAILENSDDTDMINSYQFYKTDKSNGTIIVLTDKSSEMDMLSQLKRTTIIIGSIALVILSIFAYFLSARSIQPVKVAFEKQKQFVSDASHELKTPLTVISTNADVLAGEIGENKWLDYIKSQTERMNILVNDLLSLTRMENKNFQLERKYFNLSKAVINTALPFECQAFESNKKFEVNVEDDIMLSGSEKHIKQMTAIFIDNALKYSNDGGTVRVCLKRVGDRKLLSVYNTGEGIKESDTEKIFERFYRSDESRNRSTGGYGLGLAIAKSVIDKHKFKVHVLNQPGKSVCFMVTMQ